MPSKNDPARQAAEAAPPAPQGFVEFPKVLYGKGGQKRTVQNLAEQDALGPGWKETPG